MMGGAATSQQSYVPPPASASDFTPVTISTGKLTQNYKTLGALGEHFS